MQIKSVEDLIKAAGKGEDKRTPLIQSKANENIDPTTNANWYDAYGVANEIKDLASERGMLLSRLSEGNEGSNLPDSYPVPYNITNYFMLGKTVWRDEAKPTNDNTVASDTKGTITQVPFILQMGINDEMIATSTDRQLYNKIVGFMQKAAISTMEGCIINGDIETGGTGNVNSDDQAPATTFGSAAYHSLKIDHGIRESANGNSKTFDVGAFDSDDMISVQELLADRYATKFSDLLYIFNPTTYLKAMTDDAFKLAYATKSPTVDGGLLNRPFGVDTIAHDLMPKAEADGKLSSTGSNNTLGTFACVYKPAIRWGMGQDVKFEVERINGYGFELTLTMKFGFVILDAANSVAVGRNVTL